MAKEPSGSAQPRAARGAQDTPRRAGLRALAVTLPKVTRRVLGQRGFAEGGLAAEWPGIVGVEIAARCRPGRLAFARAAERREGTLTLRVEAPFALEIQHLAPQLIERINGYFGYRAVARIKLQQVPLAARRHADAPPAPPLSPAQEAALESRLAGVEDPDLRAALGRLGRALERRGRA